MKINQDLIRRCSSKRLLPPLQAPSCGDDPLPRITHLYLQEQHVRRIENLECVPNLQALYLQDNRIEEVENLRHLPLLSCLYLQGNLLQRMQGLDLLPRLTVLNLAHNSIAKVEGLESLSELRELYLQYQTLPEGQSLEFDASSIKWLSESLRVLNVSGDGLPSLLPLRTLSRLEVLLAEENAAGDLQELQAVAGCWSRLRVARLGGNPVCGVRKYRDSMAVACLELEELDGKVISQPYRNFLLNWKQCQTLQDRKRESYALLRPFLETQLGNKQLTPPRSASVSRRSGSQSSSSEASVRSEPRSRSAMRVRSLHHIIRSGWKSKER